MYSNEQIFVWDIDALNSIISNPTPRNLLDASAILRRLLLDASNGGILVQKVSRGRDFTARFRLPGSERYLAALNKLHSQQDLLWHYQSPLIDGADKSAVATRMVSLQDFLREPLHLVAHTQLTIKDIIDYAANVGGGVHQGSPRQRDESGKVLHSSAGSLLIHGTPYPLQSIGDIVKITLDALMPLYQRVRA